MLKIIHLGKYHPPFHGGIENFMAALMQQQVAEGHQVSAIVHHHQKKQAFVKECQFDLTVYRVPYYGELIYAPISPSFGHYLTKIITIQKPDILHIHLPNLSAFWCLLSAEARKIPWIIHWHADVLGSVPDWRVRVAYQGYRIFERMLLERAKTIIATSPPYLQFSKPLKNFNAKTHIIPLGLASLDTEKNELLNTGSADEHREKTINTALSELSLLMIGRLTYYKGHKYLIEALAQISAVNLTIIGLGELESELKQQVQQLGLEQRVFFLGCVDDDLLKHSIQNCDLLCLPSIEKTEAFGLVILEAAQLEKPALVTSVKGSGMSWVVQDKKTGIVVEPNSVESLKLGLAFAKANKSLLVEYGNAAKQRLLEQFSIEKISKKIVDLY